MNWEKVERFGNRAQIPLTLGGYFGWGYALWPKGVSLIEGARHMDAYAVVAIVVVGVGLFNSVSQLGLLTHRRKTSQLPMATARTDSRPSAALERRPMIVRSGKPEIRYVNITDPAPMCEVSYNDPNATHLALVLALTNEPRVSFIDITTANAVVAHIKFFGDEEVTFDSLEESARAFVHYGAWLDEPSNTVRFEPHETHYLVLAVSPINEPDTWYCIENYAQTEPHPILQYRPVPSPLSAIGVTLVVDNAFGGHDYMFDTDDLKDMVRRKKRGK